METLKQFEAVGLPEEHIGVGTLYLNTIRWLLHYLPEGKDKEEAILSLYESRASALLAIPTKQEGNKDEKSEAA